MSKVKTKDRIVAVADDLFYRQGFEFTSFAHIAAEVMISRGNFYHHFKTKDEILDAVIAFRMKKTFTMLENWESMGEAPADRLKCFANILLVNGEKIRRFGCPVGTLLSELAKLNHQAGDKAKGIFTIFRNWLKHQFMALGYDAGAADGHAMHLLSASQGVVTLYHAFEDDIFVRREVEKLHLWIDDLAAKAAHKA